MYMHTMLEWDQIKRCVEQRMNESTGRRQGESRGAGKKKYVVVRQSMRHSERKERKGEGKPKETRRQYA